MTEHPCTAHTLTPAQRELAAWLAQPETFATLVDHLPSGPLRTLLRMWGAAHGVYTWTDEAAHEANADSRDPPPVVAEP